MSTNKKFDLDEDFLQTTTLGDIQADINTALFERHTQADSDDETPCDHYDVGDDEPCCLDCGELLDFETWQNLIRRR